MSDGSSSAEDNGLPGMEIFGIHTSLVKQIIYLKCSDSSYCIIVQEDDRSRECLFKDWLKLPNCGENFTGR